MKLALKIIFWAGVLFILFAHLDSLPIIIWDESRLAVGAYEMFKYGNPFVVTYDRGPDMWSMKPPLMIWFQVCMIKLIGYGTVAIRLPSALAALATCILIFSYLKKYTASKLLPYLAVGVLVTTPGYIMIHGARTGDYDSVYVFFSTLYVLTFFHFLKTKDNRILLLVFLGILLAVMTKSVAGLIFTPFLVIYAFYKKAVLDILKSGYFYLGLVVLVGVLLSYYLYREKLAPGSWAVVVYEELGGRLSGKLQNDKQPWSYYFRLIFKDHYYFWFPFAFLGIIKVFYERNKQNAEVFKYCCFAALYFLFVITITGTKLEWYEMPIYPFLAVVTGMFIDFLYNLLKVFKSEKEKTSFKYFSNILLLILAFYAYNTVHSNVVKPGIDAQYLEPYHISYFLKDQYQNLDDPDKYVLVNHGYYGHLLFYKYFHNEQGRKLEFKAKESLEAGDHIIIHEMSVQDFVAENYDAEEIGSYKNVKVIRINGRK